MIQIRLDHNAINVLKNFGIFIEVDKEEPAQAIEKPIETAPPYIHQRVDLGGYTEAFPDSKGHVQPRTSGYPPAPQKVPTPVMAIPRVQATTEASFVDKAGVPWDPNIHSSSKALTKDGTWRMRRGLDPQVLAQVRGEKAVEHVMQHAQAAAEGPTRTQTHIVAAMQEAPMPFVPAPIPQAAPVQHAEPVYTQSGVHAHTFQSFKDNLVEVFAALVKEGKIDQAYIDQLKKYFEIKEIWNLWASEKKLSELFENFCGANLIQRIEG